MTLAGCTYREVGGYHPLMKKTLEGLMDRVRTWPEEAQDEAVWALRSIEFRHTGQLSLTEEEREAKLAALRETLNRSIERGGSHTDEEVAASICERLDEWERNRKGR
jgi:hypothetical protein